ncbi:hypothetical protein [Chroococcidiopsis sp. CCMEE 29]|uniref:hypothetical protein n=1 Tax=Chroococcidiopsis sp. CCMEE 29 TaxID=155894 RepID=UPI0020208E45|nr:hypothetical protein [Chroococcidiopsis sp. CCMEE 29]
MKSVKPKGGRTKKEAYSSRTMRVPDPIREDVDKLIYEFHAKPVTGKDVTVSIPRQLLEDWMVKARGKTSPRWQQAQRLLSELAQYLPKN